VALDGTGSATTWGWSLNNAFQSGPLELHTLALSDSSVYVGGNGTLSDNGFQLRANLAEIERDSGRITNWRPEPDGAVHALDMSPSGSTIFVGGDFATIGNGTSYTAAEISLADGTTTDFRPVPRTTGGDPGDVTDIAVRDLTPGAPVASRRWGVLLGGSFVDVKSRYKRVNVAETALIGDSDFDGWPTDWNPRLDIDPRPDLPPTKVNDLALSGGVLAVAGNFSAAHFNAGRDLLFFRLP